MAYNKIGFHTGPGGNAKDIDSYMQQLDAAGIPFVLKAVDDYGVIHQSLAFSNADHVRVFRLSNRPNNGPQYDTPNYSLPPDEAAVAHWNMTLAGLPPEFDKSVWLEVINEPDKTRADWLGWFGVKIAELAQAAGYKVALFGFSGGEPEPADWETPGMLAYLAICAERPQTVAVALHEYSFTIEDIWALDADAAGPEPGWLVGRFQHLHAVCDKYNIPRPTILVTEWGWEYENVPGVETAVSHIADIAALYAQHPNIFGAGLWYLGGYFGGICDRAQPLILPVTNYTLTARFPDPPPIEPPGGGEGETMEKVTSTVFGGIAGLSDKTVTKISYQYEVNNGSGPNTFSQEYEIPMPAAGVDLRGVRVRAYYEHGRPPIEIGTTDPPDPDPELPYLDVEPLSQRDGRWANNVLGQPTGHSKTIGNWGCLLTAYNIQARFWGLTDRLPDAENAHYVSKGCFNAQFIQPGALRTAYPDQVIYDGFLTRDSAAMRPKIREWIDNGWPVACQVDFVPATAQWDQHWVLVIGYIGETDFYMADPWHGDVAVVNDRYPIAGSDILQAIFYRPEATSKPPDPPTGQTVDMTQYYLPPNGRAYGDISIKSTNWGQGDVRQQLQLHGGYCFVTKGGEIEKRMIVDGRIYFMLDDSPGDGKYYTVNSPTGWLPTQFAVGQVFNRQETTTFFYKANCQPTGEVSNWTNQMLFKAFYPEWTSPHGIKLANVAHLQWLANGVVEEDYYLAPGLGYAGWKNRHGRESWIKELIPAGNQGNNTFKGSCYHAAVGVEYP